MFHLIIGGSGSGKSAWAEQKLLSCGEGKRIYIATMLPGGKEAEKRIRRHRMLRAGKGFETIECYTGLKSLEVPPDSLILLESLSNLAANELFEPEGAGKLALEAIEDGIDALCQNARALFAVTDNLFSDAAVYDKDTEIYRALLGKLNRDLAAKADFVTELVVGIPRRLKPPMENDHA